MTLKLLMCALAATTLVGQERLHIRSTANNNSILFAANAIERDAPTLNWTPSMVRLRGEVEVRMPFKAVTGSPETHRYMVLHADEVDFNEGTGEFHPRGNVRISIEQPK